MAILDRRTMFDLNANGYDAFYPALSLADNLETCCYYALNHTKNIKLRLQM